MAGKKKTTACGSCNFASTSPITLQANTKVVQVTLGFEDALKLKTAIDECVLRLNGYNRSSREGRRAQLKLVVYFTKERIQVLGPSA